MGVQSRARSDLAFPALHVNQTSGQGHYQARQAFGPAVGTVANLPGLHSKRRARTIVYEVSTGRRCHARHLRAAADGADGGNGTNAANNLSETFNNGVIGGDSAARSLVVFPSG